MDLLITPITIAPHMQQGIPHHQRYLHQWTSQQQQGELGIGQCCFCFCLLNSVHEVFSSILIDIQGTDMNSMVSLQLTNLGYFRFLVGTKYAMLNFTCNLILFLIISPLHSSYGNLQTLMIKICQQKMCLTKLLMHVKQQIRS